MKAPTRPGLPGFRPAALVIAVLCAWSVAVARQEPPEGGSPGEAVPRETPPTAPATQGGDAGEGAQSEEPAGGQVPPELQSPYIVRIYKVRPARLWKGVLESLEAEGYPHEEVNLETRTVKTSFVDFKQDDYQLQVADPPQLLGGKYHVVQLLKVRQGKVSLESVVTPTKQGAELKVRARILVTGVDRVKRVRVLVDRRSTGVIESDFIHKLEARLGLEHL